ncbi:MAG: type IV pilus biogenesis/stability protein PilW [Propionivibrio sp.]
MSYARGLSILVATLVLGACSTLAPQEEKSVAPPATAFGSTVPKDIHTRARAHTELASLYFQDNNLIVALEELTLAIAINPNYAPAYSTRGLVLYYIKELESARKDFQRALQLDPRDPEINNNYGWFLCQTGNEQESIEYFQRAIGNPLYQTPEVAYLNAGACFIKLGDLDSAEDYLRKSQRLAPNNPQTLYQLANLLYLRGNLDAARDYLTDVVRNSQPGPEVLWLLLRVERRRGNAAAEESLAMQLRRKYPDSLEYQALLKGAFE